MSNEFSNRLKRDAFIIVVSILGAYFLSTSSLLNNIFLVNAQSELIGVFFAGILFTSLFTTPIAIAMFITLSAAVNPIAMAGIGALGAVVGDVVLFSLVRFSFQKDVEHLLSVPRYRRFFAIFHRRMFRWILPFVGAVIIASPLPDELGVGLMGVSRMKTRSLVVVSYIMNAIGIGLIAWAT